MTKINAFREIERKLADSLAQLEATKKTERQRETREFASELKTLMKEYRMSAADVLSILNTTPEAR